jgi:kynurenine 3-monooxygenase
VDLEGPGLAYVDEASGREERADGDLIVGADGAYSAVRRRLQMNEGFDYSQSYLEYGYKELCIPPAAGGGFALEPGGLHIWPRGGYMMIALPNRDGSFTCTLFWPYRGPESFAAVQTPREIEGFFRRRFPDAVPLMPTLVEDYLSNPVGPLVTIRCNPWHHGARAVLIGDAAHAIVPFFGQGMNAAFEDCQIFDGLIERCGPDWGRVLGAFSAEHRENAEAIADLALENFVEMRDRVSSPIFLARKRLGQILHRVFPRAFVPLYHMVSFSRIPYAEARRRARRQTLLLRAWLIAALAVAAAAAATWLIST